MANKYAKLKMVGEGSCATVYCAVESSSKSNRKFAVKIFKAPNIGLDKESRARMSQALMKNTVGYEEFLESEKTIVMEYCSQGTLQLYLGQSPWPFPERVAKIVIYFSAVGLADLHRRGIYHCDLKPSNILFDENYAVKVSDYGFKTVQQSESTKRYISPEGYAGRIAFKMSVWSLGIIFLYLLTKEHPYASGKTKFCTDLETGVPIPGLNLSAQGYEVLRGMLAKEERDRFSASDVVKHPYFDDIRAS